MILRGLREIARESVAFAISRCWPTRGAAEPPAVVEGLLAGWSVALSEWGAGERVELRQQLRAAAWKAADERDAKAESRGWPVNTEVIPLNVERAREALRLWLEEHQPGD